jgi:squalene synthase HpnC
VTATTQPRGVLARDLPAEDAILPRASGENFSVASLLLGRRTRRHLQAIYGFARLVDQLGDDAAGDRLALLDVLEEELDRAFTGTPEHPLLRRVAASVRELDLPRGPFLRLIEANRRDQRVSRYETFAELVEYCDLSANPVGELVLHVFGVATPDRVALSNHVCTALQLVEHWQDVREDYERRRIYVPAEDLVRFGVTPEDLSAPHANERVRSLLAFEVDRARRLLDDGAPLVRTLRGRARVAVAGYVGGGRATIDAIEDGHVVRSMLAFAGADSAPTPTGSFSVQAHVVSLTTDMWAAKSGHEWQLPYFVQVDGDVGIHGPKIDLRTGQPVPGPSSGCLSPSLADSVWLFGWAETGTPVHITRGY